MSIPLFKPSIRRRDMHSVLSCMVTDVIGPSSISEDLVAAIAGEYGFHGGVALREYSRAVRVLIEAIGLQRGDGVVLSPLSPGVYARTLAEHGIRPVLADVREEDATLDPDSVLKILNGSDVKAIFVHAPMGMIPDGIEDYANTGLPVVMDVGQALGARDEEGLLGNGCSYLVLPMEPEGIVTTGGGTVVLARDRANRTAVRSVSDTLTKDMFLPDMNAALGMVQWREYPQSLEIREQIAEIYVRSLLRGRHRTLNFNREEKVRPVPFSFPVVSARGTKEIRKYALKQGVQTEQAFAGCFMEYFSGEEERIPCARTLLMNTILFPLYPTLGKKNVQTISKVLSTLP